MLDTILKKAESGESLTREDVLQLLAIEDGSRAYYDLIGIADRDARSRFHGTGHIFAQIGINASPCPANCAFCSLAQEVFDPKNSFDLPLCKIEAIVRQMVDAGVDEVFLMTTADYGKEKFLECGRAIRRLMPDHVRMVANIGDFDLTYAKKLKDVGFSGAYHICRLGEGKDTQLEPRQRIHTLNAIHDAGLDLYYCVEPIGPEHTYDEIADEIFRGQEYQSAVMAVMKRVCVPDTKLYSRGEITAAELAKICAVTELTVRPTRAMGVHEPDELCLMAGANQIYAEVSVNPRDQSLQTEQSRGASAARTVSLLKNTGWKTVC